MSDFVARNPSYATARRKGSHLFVKTKNNMTDSKTEYFRRDQAKGITAPDLSKDCTYAEHIVRARGKRTRFTSVSLDKCKIDDFGPQLFSLLRNTVDDDGHGVVEHEELMKSLREAALSSEKGERARAIQAQRYAKRRLECLVNWNCSIDNIEKKNLITWAFNYIQKYFQKA
ncbi:hypothetical protein KKHLCK_06790 [Candidatus Electrothrix laxa]